MIEIDITDIEKTRKIKVKGTPKRKEHYRTIKDTKTPDDTVIASIRGWAARGGAEASRFPYSIKERETLTNYLKTAKPNAEGKTIYRGIGFSEKEWTSMFEEWTTPGNVIENDRMSSFTLDRRRAPIHTAGEFSIILAIKNKSGIDISEHSIYEEEKEVLTSKDFKWKITGADTIRSSTWVIEGEEI